jgi:hypothetical protein
MIHFIIFSYYKKFTQQYEHRINCRSLCFYVLLRTLFQYSSKIPCFVETKSKQQMKYVVYQNKNAGFFTTKYLQFLSLFSKLCVIILFFFLRYCIFGQSKSHHHDSKPTKIQNSKLTMFHE